MSITPPPSRRPHPHIASRSRTDKISTEVLTLTYGTLVSQLCQDLTLPSSPATPDYPRINNELDRMGHAIGLRLIEDFLAKTNTGQCSTLRETAEMIAKVGFKVFMNVVPSVGGWDKEGRSFVLGFEENPLGEWVELPDDGKAQGELWFSNVLCGVIRGALEMVSLISGCSVSSKVILMNDPRCKCRLRHTLLVMFCVATIRLSYG